jgi:hypothetical protein
MLSGDFKDNFKTSLSNSEVYVPVWFAVGKPLCTICPRNQKMSLSEEYKDRRGLGKTLVQVGSTTMADTFRISPHTKITVQQSSYTTSVMAFPRNDSIIVLFST